MSGGHWDYLESKLEDQAEELRYAANALEFLGALEHELDWGYSHDTCAACAERRVIAALSQFFEDRAHSTMAAIAIVRDDKQNRCPKHEPKGE